jgi:hypothetical protein
LLLTATAIGTSSACTNNAAVSANGGTSPYAYTWSNGALTSTISNVPAGTYSVIVTDANGCSASSTVILNRQAFNPSAQTTDVSCFAGNDGTITVTNANAVAPLSYSINGTTFQSGSTFIGLAAGTYTITVRDANGCFGFVTKTIQQPTQIQVVVNNITQTCAGQSNGAITITPSGGAGAFTFEWAGPGGFTSTKQSPTNLPAGNYTAIVKDKNSCSTTLAATVPAFAAINVVATLRNVACRGEVNGSITLSVSGGSSNFSFSWSTGATTKDIFNLPAGSYSVTIRDSVNGCIEVRNYSITQPAATLSFTTIRTNATGCSSLGTITAAPSGGTAPYTYRLNNGTYQSAGTFTGLSGGDYTVWVRDANGCATSKIVTITDSGTDEYEGNNAKNQAKQIPINAAVYARIGASADVDWFKFTTSPQAGQFIVTLTHPSINYNFQLYPANGTVAVTPLSSSATTKMYNLAANSTYYVYVQGTVSLACYTLNVSIPSITATNATNQQAEVVEVVSTPETMKASVFPNPHKGAFKIQVASPITAEASVELINAAGQKFTTRKVSLIKGEGNIIAFSGVAPGIIFYRIHAGKYYLTGKIVGAN